MLRLITICSGKRKNTNNQASYNVQKNILYTIFAFIFAWFILFALVNGILGKSIPFFLPLYFSALYVLFIIWSTDKKRMHGGLGLNNTAIVLLILLYVSLVSVIFRNSVLTEENFQLAIKALLFSSMAIFLPRCLLLYSHHVLRIVTTFVSPFLIMYIVQMILSGGNVKFGLSLNDNYNIAAFSSLIIAYLIRFKYQVVEFIMRFPFFGYAILSGSKKFAVLTIGFIVFDFTAMLIRRGERVFSFFLLTLFAFIFVNCISISKNVPDIISWDSYFNRFLRVESAVEGRIDRINHHLDNIDKAPFLGTGDFSYSAHNILIQAWSEGGLIHALSSLIIIILLLCLLFFSDVKVGRFVILSIAFLFLGDHYFWDRMFTLYLLLFIPLKFLTVRRTKVVNVLFQEST